MTGEKTGTLKAFSRLTFCDVSNILGLFLLTMQDIFRCETKRTDEMHTIVRKTLRIFYHLEKYTDSRVKQEHSRVQPDTRSHSSCYKKCS